MASRPVGCIRVGQGRSLWCARYLHTTGAPTLTSERLRARRRGSGLRCPKSTRRRRARQRAMADRRRALPARQLSTVSTTACGGGMQRVVWVARMDRSGHAQPTTWLDMHRIQHGWTCTNQSSPPNVSLATEAGPAPRLTLALARRVGATQLIQQTSHHLLTLRTGHAV